MAEPDKVTASSSKAKEKTCSILDDDISKNFLGSWNTSLGAESDDSSMDFKYEPAKGKKENFNFDKLDMDFSLDGEFGKMDSFKDDMGDLDFSSPAKTSAKTKATDIDFSSPPKERTDGSEKSKKGKKDCFAFSFDFNDLDKFDLDAVLPTRTKDLAKDYGDKGVKIKSTEKKEDQSSNIQVTGTDASEADVLKDKSKLMNPKENLAACVDEFDMLLQSDSSKTSSRGVSTDKLSKSENKACSESCEKSKLQNQATHFVQDERLSEPALICSEGATTEHAQSIENQSDQVKSSNENSNEMPKVQNQSACSFPDKINAPDVPEQMQTTLADEKSGDVDSETPTLNAKIDSSLTSENENYPVEKMMPHYESKHVRSLEVVLEVTDEEENSSERSNVLKGDMATTTVGETVADVKESDAVDLPKLGHHVAEPTSGRQKTRTDISSSLVSRFNLKPLTKDESPASAQVSHRSNLVSLNRNTSSLHPNPSGARHSAESARIRSNMDKSSASRNKEVIGGHLVSENNMKVANDQSTRGNCNSTEAPTKINLDVGGKAVERGATFPGIENKEEDTKSSSIQVQSSVLPDRTSKTTNQASLNLKPKVPSFESVRKLKMDTVVGKLSTLKVSKKIPNLEGLKLLSSPALKDKAVIANNLNKNYMTVAAKKVPPVGSVNPRSPALSMKRKISEVSDAAPTMSNASKRISASHSRTSKDDSEEMAREEVTIYKNILDCSLKGDSNKHSESTFEIPHEMKFPDVGVTASLEKDEYVEKAEAFGKELDQICSILRKKQEEAKELLVQALVANNRLLLLGSPMHAQKLCQVKGFAARLISKELPSSSRKDIISGINFLSNKVPQNSRYLVPTKMLHAQFLYLVTRTEIEGLKRSVPPTSNGEHRYGIFYY